MNGNRKIITYSISFLSTGISIIPGVILYTQLQNKTPLLIALSVLSVIPIILFALNLILTKRFTKRITQLNVAEGNAFLLSHRNDAEKTTAEKLKELRRIRKVTTAYTVCMLIPAIAIGMLAGFIATDALPLSLICILYSGLVFASVLTRLRIRKQIPLDDNVAVLSPDEYPLIYSMARKAADTVGSTDDIVILPNWDFSASIIRDKDRYLLRIGVVLANVLSEQELYTIMLHEFAHVSQDKNEHYREEHYSDWLSAEGGGTDKLSAFLANLYMYLSVKYLFVYMIYRYACSVVYETQADKAMAEHGDPSVAISALLKTHYDTLYYWESTVRDEPSIFESAELKADYLTNRIASFKNAIALRSEDWNALVEKEILANNASHPTLKMRMDTLGVDKLVLTPSSSSPEYLAQMQRMLDFSEQFIYRERKESYETERKERYLDPCARIEAWKESGEPISSETYADIISDLKILGRHQEAEALCDRVIEQLPGMSATHAVFMKGCAMLYRYDANGMDLIYRAMEANGNYVDEGLDTIGSFCCLTGREADLLEYRKKALLLAQKHMDEDEKISFLSKSDNLTRENLPQGMLEEILAFIKSVDMDIIENIYLVRKTVSESFFASVFIIQFRGGTDAQRHEIMHKIFRYLDSYHIDWQFSLFDYFDYPEIKVEKIEGSLVYSKNNNKES